MTESDVANSLYDLVEGTGVESGPLRWFIISQLLYAIWWRTCRLERWRVVVEPTLGSGLVEALARHGTVRAIHGVADVSKMRTWGGVVAVGGLHVAYW